MESNKPKVTVAPRVVEAYRRVIDRAIDERGARIAVARDAAEYFTIRRPTLASPPRTDADGAEIWRAGPHRVPYHVHVHSNALNVIGLDPPHAHWRPITVEKARALPGTRPQSNLGLLMRHQRERREMTVDVLANLAGVTAEEIGSLERGEGVADSTLAAVCDVLDVDVLVKRRLR